MKNLKKKGGAMKFTSIKEEIDYSKKRYKLKKDIEELLTGKNYINYESNTVADYDSEYYEKTQINSSETVKLINGNGSVSILSSDITTNLLNDLIPNWEKEYSVKLFYYGKIFNRVNNKIKEIRQMGAECIGVDTLDSDKEILDLLISIMGKYSSEYIIEIGTSEYLKGILNEFYLDEKEYSTILGFINKKNKEDLIKYMKKFEKNEIREILTNIIDMKGSVEEVLSKANNYYVNNKMKKGLDELKEINRYLKNNGLDQKNIICDLSMTSSLNYYSGLMFKSFYKESNKEIIKGGRYDIDYDGYGDVIPAIGFSIEIDELLRNLYKRRKI